MPAVARRMFGPEDTRLYDAAENGDLSEAVKLLDAGVWVNIARLDDGATPLYAAASKGLWGMVDLLIKRMADVNMARTSDGAPPLHAAATGGHVAVVELLLDNLADVDKAKTDKGATPMHAAAAEGHEKVTNLLITAGADINKESTENKTTPLKLAAWKGHVKVAESLVNAGADMDKATTNGHTPLHAAASGGHLAVVRLLVEKDRDHAEFARRDGTGTTALHLAAWHGHMGVVKYLVEKLAPIDQADDHGRTALHFSAQYNKDNNISVYLLDKGAEISKLDKPLLAKLLKKLKIPPLLADDKQFQHAVGAMSVVSALVATIVFVGWFNPPGGFLNGLTMLDSEAVVQCGGDKPATKGVTHECDRYRVPLQAFFVFVGFAFILAIGANIVALIVVIPRRQTKNFFEQVNINCYYFLAVSTLLGLALICGLGAFTAASFAVIPRRYLESIVIVMCASFGVVVVAVLVVCCLPKWKRLRKRLTFVPAAEYIRIEV